MREADARQFLHVGYKEAHPVDDELVDDVIV